MNSLSIFIYFIKVELNLLDILLQTSAEIAPSFLVIIAFGQGSQDV